MAQHWSEGVGTLRFTGREYQQELIEIGCADNLLACPPEQAANFVALKVLQEMAYQIRPPNRKKTVFVTQLRKLKLLETELSQLTDLCVVSLSTYRGAQQSGDKDGDKEHGCGDHLATAKSVAEQCQVMVVISSVLEHMLAKGDLNMSTINLLIIDECHSVASNKYLQQIMSFYSKHKENGAKREDIPRIIAFSYPLFTQNSPFDNCSLDNTANNIQQDYDNFVNNRSEFYYQYDCDDLDLELTSESDNSSSSCVDAASQSSSPAKSNKQTTPLEKNKSVDSNSSTYSKERGHSAATSQKNECYDSLNSFTAPVSFDEETNVEYRKMTDFNYWRMDFMSVDSPEVEKEEKRLSVYDKLEYQLEKLEEMLGCKTDMAADIVGLKKITGKPREVLLQSVDGSGESFLCSKGKKLKHFMKKTVFNALLFLDDHRYDPLEIYGDDTFGDELRAIPNPVLEPRELLYQFLYVLDQAGPYAADKAAFMLLMKIEKLKVKIPYERHFLLLCLVTSVFLQIRSAAEIVFGTYTNELEKINKFTSPKVLRLMDIFKLFKPKIQAGSETFTMKDKSVADDKPTVSETVTLDNVSNTAQSDISGSIVNDLGNKVVENYSTDGLQNNDEIKMFSDLSESPSANHLSNVGSVTPCDSNSSHSVSNSAEHVKATDEPLSCLIDQLNSCDFQGLQMKLNEQCEGFNLPGDAIKCVNENNDVPITGATCSVTEQSVSSPQGDEGDKSISDNFENISVSRCSSMSKEKSKPDEKVDDVCYTKGAYETLVHTSGNLYKTTLRNEDVSFQNMCNVLGNKNCYSSKSEEVGDCTSTEFLEESADVRRHSQNKSVVDVEPHRSSPKKKHYDTGKRGRKGEGRSHNWNDPEALCGLVFVDEPLMAKILYSLIYEYSRHDLELNFISAQFIVDKTADPQTEPKDAESEHKLQEEVLRRFRMHECNLLIGTSILEDGMDLPKCNLVVRWDPPRGYRCYAQCRSRARAPKSLYALMAPENPIKLVSALAHYAYIEKMLVRKCRWSEPGPMDEARASEFTPLIHPYRPDQQAVTLAQAVQLVNRYCAKLPSDTFTRLVPLWTVEKINYKGSTLYVCSVRMPINSPLKNMIVGHPMPTKVLARRIAALQVCRALHLSGELDDNLLPIGKESFRALEPDWVSMLPASDNALLNADTHNEPRPGTTKRKQYYYKKIAKSLADCRPVLGRPCLAYEIQAHLAVPLPERHNTRGRKLHPPENYSEGFCILTNKPIHDIPLFPLFTRSGEIRIQLVQMPVKVVMNKRRTKLVHRFMKYTFKDVLRVHNHLMVFNPCKGKMNNYYIVPTNKVSNEDGTSEVVVDWDFLELIYEHTKIDKKQQLYNKASSSDAFVEYENRLPAENRTCNVAGCTRMNCREVKVDTVADETDNVENSNNEGLQSDGEKNNTDTSEKSSKENVGEDYNCDKTIKLVNGNVNIGDTVQVDKSDINKSTDDKENGNKSIDDKDNVNKSIDDKEKGNKSIDDNVNKSIDDKDNVNKSIDDKEKGNKSIDDNVNKSIDDKDNVNKSIDDKEKGNKSIDDKDNVNKSIDDNVNKSIDDKEKGNKSIDDKDNVNKSIDDKEKGNKSIDDKDNVNKSIDDKDNVNKSIDDKEKDNKSIDDKEIGNKSIDGIEKSNKSIDDKKIGDKSTDDKVKSNKSIDNKEIGNKFIDDNEKGNKSIDDKDNVNKSRDDNEENNKSADDKEKSNKSADDKEKINKSADDKEKINKSADDKEKSNKSADDKEKINKSADDKEKINKSADDKEKINKSADDKEKINKSADDKEKINKSADDKEKINKSADDKEKSNKSADDKEKINKSADDKEKINKSADDKEKINKSADDKEKINKSRDDNEENNKSADDKEKSNKSADDKEKINKSADDKEKINKSADDKEKSNKSADDKEKINKSADDKEKINKSADDKEKINKSADDKEKINKSADDKEKINKSADDKEKINKSADDKEKINKSADDKEKINKSADDKEKSNKSSDDKGKGSKSSDDIEKGVKCANTKTKEESIIKLKETNENASEDNWKVHEKVSSVKWDDLDEDDNCKGDLMSDQGAEEPDEMPNPYLCPGEMFQFDYDKYRDAVVTPWYRNQNQPQYFYVAEICWQLNPLSAFPSAAHPSFLHYYHTKYGVNITQMKQPLLDVDHTSARLNLLTPRFVNRKGVALPTSSERTKRAKRELLEQKQILVPELCCTHLFRGALWRAAVALPCVLYRINSLLLADEIRRSVAIRVSLGKAYPPSDFSWPPLDFGWSLADVLKEKANSPQKDGSEENAHQINSSPHLNDGHTVTPEGDISEGESETPNAKEEITDKIGAEAVLVDGSEKEKTANEIIMEKEKLNDSGDMFEVGTWSNEMAGATPASDDDVFSKLPGNVTMCPNNTDDSAWNADLSVKYGGGAYSQPHIRKYSVADSDTSYISSDMSGCETNSEDEEELLNVLHRETEKGGIRIEFKSGNEAEAIEILSSIEEVSPEDENDLEAKRMEEKASMEAFNQFFYARNTGDKDPDMKKYIENYQIAIKANEERINQNGTLVNCTESLSNIKLHDYSENIPFHTPKHDGYRYANKHMDYISILKKNANSLHNTHTYLNDITKDNSKIIIQPCDRSKSESKNIFEDTLCEIQKRTNNISTKQDDDFINPFPDIYDKALSKHEIIALFKNMFPSESIPTNDDFNSNPNTVSLFKDGGVYLEDLEDNKRRILNEIKTSMSKEQWRKYSFFAMKDFHKDDNFEMDYKDFHGNGNDIVVTDIESDKGDSKCEPDKTFSFDHQPDLKTHPGPSPSIILQAMTMSNANDGINLERLETVGDSFLKYAITVYLYCSYPNIHEGKLSYLRSKQVSNLNLYRLGKRRHLGGRMVACKFEPHDNWLPPCHKVPAHLERALIHTHIPSSLWNVADMPSLHKMSREEVEKLVYERVMQQHLKPSSEDGEDVIPSNTNGMKAYVEFECLVHRERNNIQDDSSENNTKCTCNSVRKESGESVSTKGGDNCLEEVPCFVPYNLITQHSIPDKSIADCVEALIGAYLIECGPRGALLFMAWLGIRVLPRHELVFDPSHPFIKLMEEAQIKKRQNTADKRERNMERCDKELKIVKDLGDKTKAENDRRVTCDNVNDSAKENIPKDNKSDALVQPVMDSTVIKIGNVDCRVEGSGNGETNVAVKKKNNRQRKKASTQILNSDKKNHVDNVTVEREEICVEPVQNVTKSSKRKNRRKKNKQDGKLLTANGSDESKRNSNKNMNENEKVPQSAVINKTGSITHDVCDEAVSHNRAEEEENISKMPESNLVDSGGCHLDVDNREYHSDSKDSDDSLEFSEDDDDEEDNSAESNDDGSDWSALDSDVEDLWCKEEREPGSLLPYKKKDGKWVQVIFGQLEPPPSPLLRYVPDPDGELAQMLSGYEELENTLKYRFRDRSYLLQAMTHASHTNNRLTDCYQRLEFLGDAVLDYLITRQLYEDPRRHSPGPLTDLRSALVNNTIFASLAVRHGMHKFFRHLSPGLNEVLARFVKIQEENGHSISEEHYLIQEDECEQAEDVEVPKALGDLFESVAGAIFLDSDMSLDTVWRVYYALMHKEMELFSETVPKSPVRELLEMEPETTKFSKPEKLADGRRVRVTVEVLGVGAFKGVGRNFRIAKCTAAKCALRHLNLLRGRISGSGVNASGKLRRQI